MDRNHAGGPSLGGHAEQEGLKGYSDDDTPLRDGHVQEPDLPDEALDDAFADESDEEE